MHEWKLSGYCHQQKSLWQKGVRQGESTSVSEASSRDWRKIPEKFPLHPLLDCAANVVSCCCKSAFNKYSVFFFPLRLLWRNTWGWCQYFSLSVTPAFLSCLIPLLCQPKFFKSRCAVFCELCILQPHLNSQGKGSFHFRLDLTMHVRINVCLSSQHVLQIITLQLVLLPFVCHFSPKTLD